MSQAVVVWNKLLPAALLLPASWSLCSRSNVIDRLGRGSRAQSRLRAACSRRRSGSSQCLLPAATLQHATRSSLVLLSISTSSRAGLQQRACCTSLSTGVCMCVCRRSCVDIPDAQHHHEQVGGISFSLACSRCSIQAQAYFLLSLATHTTSFFHFLIDEPVHLCLDLSTSFCPPNHHDCRWQMSTLFQILTHSSHLPSPLRSSLYHRLEQ